MSTSRNRRADREALIALTEALQVSKGNLRRDPCGDWNVCGLRGHISTDGVGQYVFLQPGSKRKWEKVKRTLAFLTITQDGDDEGVFKIAGTLTAKEAELLRKYLGLRKVSLLTDEQRATLRRFSFARDKTPVSPPSFAATAEALGDDPSSTQDDQDEEALQNETP